MNVLMRAGGAGHCLTLGAGGGVETGVSSNGVHVLGGGAALAGGVVMGLVANQGLDGDAQALFILLSYCDYGFPVLAVPGPDGDFVPLGPDVDHSPAHVFTGLVERLANQTQERLHPVAVQVVVSLLFTEGHQPPPPQLVPVILPHGLDAVLEKAIVTAKPQLAGLLYVVI